MRLFDSIGEEEEEVVIKEKEESVSEEETRLGKEVSEKVAGSSSDPARSKDSSGTGVDLPGMGSGSSSNSSASASKIDIEDVHEQNQEIISLLKDIRDEVGGGSNELL